MASKGATRAMSDRHEEFLADLIGGSRMPGSGNGFANQMDVRNSSLVDFPIALDGKSTRGKSLSITLDMIEKAREQAHHCHPGFGLRFYHDDRLTKATDFIAVEAELFQELLQAARQLRAMPEITDLAVRTGSPTLLDETLQQLPGPPGRVVEDSWNPSTRICTVRVLGDPGFVKFALTQQGYGELIE